MSILAEILSSKARAEVFRLLFSGTEDELYLREIERQSNLAVTTISKELNKLLRHDLLVSRKDGNRLYYKANLQHPLYIDIKNLVSKTSGLLFILKERLNDKRIKIAFVFGSFAKGEEKATSDIDLFIIGNLGLRDVSKILSGFQEKIGREVNPHVYSHKRFVESIKTRDHFVSSVLKSKKTFVVGNEDELKRIS